MTRQELNQWWMLRKQIVNGYHMSEQDTRELLRLNHLVMEASHKIHNDSMLSNKPLDEMAKESFSQDIKEDWN